MIKEAKNVDFYTTGRQPSEQEFAKISEWIKKKGSAEKGSEPFTNKASRLIIITAEP